MNWNEEHKKWIEPVGLLMVTFGHIEYSLMVCLLFLGSRETWDKYKTVEFKRKASESIKVLETLTSDYPISKRAIALINDAIKLAAYRNLVAHNPLNLNLFEAAGEYESKSVIRSLRNDEMYIDYETMVEVTSKTHGVAAELYDITQRIWNERW